MSDLEPLIARLVELRWPGRRAGSVERERYAKLSVHELERMVSSLEQGAELAAKSRKIATDDVKARAALEERVGEALAKLDVVSDRVASRRKLPALAQAQKAVHATPAESPDGLTQDEHFEQIFGLLEKNNEHSMLLSLQMRSVLEEFSEPWRKSAVDKLAGLISDSEPGNLIFAIDNALGLNHPDALSKHRIVERYLEFALQKTSWGVARLLDKQLRASGRADPRLKRLLSQHILGSSVFEPSFLTDVTPVLTATAATEALAKMSLFTSEFEPTRIISVGTGGQIVGRFLRYEMRMDHRRFMHCDLSASSIRDAMQSTSSTDRILIVSDVAGVAKDVERLHEALGSSLGVESVAYTALAGRAEVYEEIRANPLVYFVNLTGQHDAKVPWSRGGSYHRTAASHFFGHLAPSPLRVAKDFFATVTAGIRALAR